jgi:hypothetical protein
VVHSPLAFIIESKVCRVIVVPKITVPNLGVIEGKTRSELIKVESVIFYKELNFIAIANFDKFPIKIEQKEKLAVAKDVKQIINIKEVGSNQVKVTAMGPSEKFSKKEFLEQLNTMLRLFNDLFVIPDIWKSADVEPQSVILTQNDPVQVKLQRFTPDEVKKIAEEINTMLKCGIIRPSKSPYAAGIVLVLKLNGSIRFCIDFRKLNAIIIMNSYLLPRIDDILDCLVKVKVMSKMDLKSGLETGGWEY